MKKAKKKKAVKRKAVKKKKKAVKKKAVKKKAVKKRAVKRKAPIMQAKDYGVPPARIDQYEPITNFNPNKPPRDFIVVKMNHRMLDKMLQALTRKGAQAIGVPCKKV